MCDQLSDFYKIGNFSVGQLLRETDNPTVENCMMKAKIVPIEITCEILMEAVKKSNHEILLIDGFPRNMENLQGFLSNKIVNQTIQIKSVLYLSCSEKTCTERVLARGDRIGSLKRKDDNLQILKKRFESFEKETKKVISEFELRDVPVYKIDTELPKEQVFELIVGKNFLKS